MFMKGRRRDTFERKKNENAERGVRSERLLRWAQPCLYIWKVLHWLTVGGWSLSLFSLKRNQVGVGRVWLLSCKYLRCNTRPLF